MSGQMTRAAALAELEKPIADPTLVREDLDYVAKKFGMSVPEFEALMAEPRRSYHDYPNDDALMERLKQGMRFAQRQGLLPRQVGM